MNIKYKLNRGHITQKIRKKTTIFSGENSILYTLNPTASYIYQGLKLGWSLEKITDGIVKQYEVTEESARKDIAHFLKELEKKKIIMKAENS